MTQHNDNDKLREVTRNLIADLDDQIEPLCMDPPYHENLEAVRSLLDEPTTPVWQAHEPFEGAVAPDGVRHCLLRDGFVMDNHNHAIWRAIPDRTHQEIIAYCTSAEPPAKDADGYYKHDGSDVAPVDPNALIEAITDHDTKITMKACELAWDEIDSWRPVGEG